MTSSLIDQEIGNTFWAQIVLTHVNMVSTLGDLEAILNKSVEEIMNLTGLKTLKITHIQRKDILKNSK